MVYCDFRMHTVCVDSTKPLNFYGANYCACLNWDGAHNRAIIIIHLKKSVKGSYNYLECKTLGDVVYEDKCRPS